MKGHTQCFRCVTKNQFLFIIYFYFIPRIYWDATASNSIMSCIVTSFNEENTTLIPTREYSGAPYDTYFHHLQQQIVSPSTTTWGTAISQQRQILPLPTEEDAAILYKSLCQFLWQQKMPTVASDTSQRSRCCWREPKQQTPIFPPQAEITDTTARQRSGRWGRHRDPQEVPLTQKAEEADVKADAALQEIRHWRRCREHTKVDTLIQNNL